MRVACRLGSNNEPCLELFFWVLFQNLWLLQLSLYPIFPKSDSGISDQNNDITWFQPLFNSQNDFAPETGLGISRLKHFLLKAGVLFQSSSSERNFAYGLTRNSDNKVFSNNYNIQGTTTGWVVKIGKWKTTLYLVLSWVVKAENSSEKWFPT